MLQSYKESLELPNVLRLFNRLKQSRSKPLKYQSGIVIGKAQENPPKRLKMRNKRVFAIYYPYVP